MKNIIFLVAALIALCAAQSVGTGCTADVEVVERSGSSWDIPGGRGTIFDVTVTNAGTCPISDVGLSLFFPTGSDLISLWSLEPTSRYYLLSNFGDLLQAGASANAGLVVFLNSSYDGTVSAEVYGSACPDSCESGTAAPTTTPTDEPTEAPTDAPTGEPTEAPTDAPTDEPTAAPTGEPTSAPTICLIDSSLNKDGSWEQDGVTYTLYRITLINNGTCPLTNFNTGFGTYPGEVVTTWNLESGIGGYAVVGFGDSLAPGATYSGAGLIVSNNTDVPLQVYGSACQC